MAGRKTYRVLLADEAGALPLMAQPLFAGGALVPCEHHCTPATLLEAVAKEAPDIIVMEVSSGGAGFASIEAVMADRPTPILVLESTAEDKEAVFHALALGALDVVTFPLRPGAAFWADVARRLMLLAQVRVVCHVQGSRRKKPPEPRPVVVKEPAFPLVAIAASLGGPKALSTLLKLLPEDFPAAVCICQHISEGFTAGLAQWLGSESRMRVVEARDGQVLQPGLVYIAPSGAAAHLLVCGDGTLRLDEAPPIKGFRPSCDALLSSCAESYGRHCTGVILTGMGKDGARGLLDIREHGGHTIAQDQASCVVYGMPREAVLLGAVAESLPLELIPAALMKQVASC